MVTTTCSILYPSNVTLQVIAAVPVEAGLTWEVGGAECCSCSALPRTVVQNSVLTLIHLKNK